MRHPGSTTAPLQKKRNEMQEKRNEVCASCVGTSIVDFGRPKINCLCGAVTQPCMSRTGVYHIFTPCAHLMFVMVLSVIFFFRYQVGEIMKNPDLAATFELLAEKGIDEFYSGQLAKEIVDAAQVIKAWTREHKILVSLPR